MSGHRVRFAAFCGLALVLAGCGTEYSDPIRRGAVESDDPCGAWSTQSECRADTAHGCSFQPNVVGCHVDDPSCSPGLCRGGDPFVRRSGETLWLHGAPYTFIGTVSWGIAWAPEGCQVLSSPEEAVQRTFDDLVDSRASALKIWAFQSFAGPSGDDYTSFERIVAAARRAGVRLIFVLENEWEDCTLGGARSDAWFAGQYLAPYGGYALSLPDYARGVVSHFRDEPTILGWEIMHEARAEEFLPIDGFAQRLSSVVREADPNHLIALGVDNGDSQGTSRTGEPSNYHRLHEHAAIDLLDVHDFSGQGPALPEGMSEVLAIGSLLQKPVFAGATGAEVADASPANLAARARLVEQKLEAALAAGLTGFLVYDYRPDWSLPGLSFDARPEDPLGGPSGVIARHAPSNH